MLCFGDVFFGAVDEQEWRFAEGFGLAQRAGNFSAVGWFFGEVEEDDVGGGGFAVFEAALAFFGFRFNLPAGGGEFRCSLLCGVVPLKEEEFAF